MAKIKAQEKAAKSKSKKIEPDVITLLDFLSRWMRKRFFGRIAGGGGLYKRLVFCMLSLTGTRTRLAWAPF
jgi:hypothetical protein